MAGTAHAVPAFYCRDIEVLAARLVASAPRKTHPSGRRVGADHASTDRGIALADPRYHQAGDGIVADGSINPDVGIATEPQRSSVLPRRRRHNTKFKRLNSCGRVFLAIDTREQVFARSAMPCPCAVTTAVIMVVFIGLFDGRVRHATSNGRIRPEGRLCLDRLPATARPAFFPCRQVAAFLAGQKSRLTPSSASLRA